MRVFLACVSLFVFSCSQPPKEEMDGGSVNPRPHLSLEGATAACTAPTVLGRSDGSCLPAAACNPLRRDACSAGEVCDWRGEGFACQPATSNSATDCQTCDASAGRFCAQGLTCLGGQCVRYCCDDSDCGDNAKCQKSELDQTAAGACVAKPPAECMGADVLFDGGTCAACMSANCCSTAIACVDETECRTCVSGDPSACDTSTVDEPLYTCRAAHCSDVCPARPTYPIASCAAVTPAATGSCAAINPGAGVHCNLVTNGGCDSNTDACATSIDGTRCRNRILRVDLCETCSESDGLFCRGGMTCFAGQCARFCCSDAECGAGARCLIPNGTVVGNCVE